MIIGAASRAAPPMTTHRRLNTIFFIISSLV
jgi:hypothetical protein